MPIESLTKMRVERLRGVETCRIGYWHREPRACEFNDAKEHPSNKLVCNWTFEGTLMRSDANGAGVISMLKETGYLVWSNCHWLGTPAGDTRGSRRRWKVHAKVRI